MPIRLSPTIVDDGFQVGPRWPYPGYREIDKPEDARTAVLDQTRELEELLHPDLVKPFYRLLWLFNFHGTTRTTHGYGKVWRYTDGLRRHWDRDFFWAKIQVLSVIIMSPIDEKLIDTAARSEVFQQETIWGMARELHMVLEAARQRLPKKKRKQVGQCIWLIPKVVRYYLAGSREPTPGFGLEMRIMGYSRNSETQAGQRWSAATRFVERTIRELPPLPES